MKQKLRFYGSIAAMVVLLIAIAAVVWSFNLKVELKGSPEVEVDFGQPYKEAGATATLHSSLFTAFNEKYSVKPKEKVDTSRLGDYKLNYSTSWLIYGTSATRTVHVVDKKPPELSLQGKKVMTITAGTKFNEPGFSVMDNVDGDLTKTTEVSGQVDAATPGTYTLRYKVSDKSGNTSNEERKVTVAPSNRKVIYLTFDDGPGPYTAKLLETLAAHKIHATFFVTGYGDHSLIAREAREGHSVGVHTYTHDYKQIYASKAAFMEDLNKINDLVEKQTGKKSKLLRFPGGSSNTVSSFTPGIMTELVRDLTEQGYVYFDWNVESGDAGKVKTSEEIFHQVTTAVARNNSSVVLQHDTKEFSVDAVGRIIDWGLANGYTFLPLDESSPGMHHPVAN